MPGSEEGNATKGRERYLVTRGVIDHMLHLGRIQPKGDGNSEKDLFLADIKS